MITNKTYPSQSMIMIDFTAKEVSILLELLDLAIDTRTPLDSTDNAFADMTNLVKKLKTDPKDVYTGNNFV